MGLFSKLKNLVSGKKEEQEEKTLDLYDNGLEKTRESFVSKLNILGHTFTSVSEEYYEELENLLIMADIGVNMNYLLFMLIILI